MMLRFLQIFLFVLMSTVAFANTDAPQEIKWDDLLPEGELERLQEMYQKQIEMLYQADPIMEGSANDKAVQFGTFNVVEELDGENVRIPGYMVPLDLQDGKVTEFLLVPYFGACIHSPPPPPNQTVFVTSVEPVEFSWDAFWLEGTLKTETAESELANAAYTLELSKIEPYSS